MNEEILKLINGDTWIASDHHHKHKKIGDFEPSRIIKATELGYDSYEDMLVENHNNLVKDDDIVLFLGDFSFASPIDISRYKGRKILIIGNHDQRGNDAYLQAGFEFVIRGAYVLQNDYILHCKYKDPQQSMLIKQLYSKTIAFTHYPLGHHDEYNFQRASDPEFTIQKRIDYEFGLAMNFDVDTIIHGHLHSKIADSQFFEYHNVCVEHTDFKPIQIKTLFDKKNDTSAIH